MSEFTPEQVERAAEALRSAREHFAAIAGSGPIQVWEDTGESRGIDHQATIWARRGERICAEALTVLSAAGAPEVTEDMVLRGALVLDPEAFADPLVAYGEGAARQSRGDALVQSREVLCAALGQSGASEKFAPVVDEAALSEFLKSPTHAPMETHSRADGSCSECPWSVYQLPPAELAAAVAAYLRGESK